MTGITFLVLLSIILISCVVFCYLEYKQIKNTFNAQLDELEAKLSNIIEDNVTNLDAKINETINLIANADKFLVSLFDIPFLEDKLKEQKYPSTLDFEVQYNINSYFVGQKIKLKNGQYYTITRGGKNIQVTKSD